MSDFQQQYALWDAFLSVSNQRSVPAKPSTLHGNLGKASRCARRLAAFTWSGTLDKTGSA